MTAKRVLGLFSLLLAVACLFFMTVNANGNWAFVLHFRTEKLLMLLTIGYTIGVSTLLFQTLTHNPILTPSILGFDALYLFTQTVLIFLLGSVGLPLIG